MGYVQDFSGLAVTSPLAPIPDPDHPGFVIVPLRFENGSDAQFYGGEVSARVETKRVKAQAAYSQWRGDVDQREAFMDPDAERPETILPRHQLLARVDLDLRKDLEADVPFRMLSARPAVDVDGYLEADARVSWCPWKSLSDRGRPEPPHGARRGRREPRHGLSKRTRAHRDPALVLPPARMAQVTLLAPGPCAPSDDGYLGLDVAGSAVAASCSCMCSAAWTARRAEGKVTMKPSP